MSEELVSAIFLFLFSSYFISPPHSNRSGLVFFGENAADCIILKMFDGWMSRPPV